MKKRNLFIIINAIWILVFIIFTVLIFLLDEQKIFLGVLLRLAMSMVIIFDAVYMIFVKRWITIEKKGDEKYRRLAGIVVFIVGLIGLITAFQGYGINGYPLFDWKSIF